MTRGLSACGLVLSVVALFVGCAQPVPTLKKTDRPATTDRFDTEETNDAGPPRPCVKDPSYYDVPNDGCDNDGDGVVDNPPTCDDAEAGDTAESFARGMGICTRASEAGYGLVSARFTRGHGRSDPPQAGQHGLLAKFGDVVKPREGQRLGVLSTGYAQEFNGSPGEPFSRGRDWYGAVPGSGGNGTAPPGFPKGAQGCPQEREVNDVVDLHLELKAPKNASGFAFDFNFHSGEWPAFICTKYNDGFVAYLNAASYNGGKPDNISFDSLQNPVSVNNGFFDRCTPGAPLGCGAQSLGLSKCPSGPGELSGTGFGLVGTSCGAQAPHTLGGATGWLYSQAPILGEETFTLDLMIWDVGDGILDSSVLLDNFRWALGEVSTTTDRPPDVK